MGVTYANEDGQEWLDESNLKDGAGMIERHYCLCGAGLEASGEEETVKSVAAMFWRSHQQSGHGPTNAIRSRHARIKREREDVL
jgi:hypothetical protein